MRCIVCSYILHFFFLFIDPMNFIARFLPSLDRFLIHLLARSSSLVLPPFHTPITPSFFSISSSPFGYSNRYAIFSFSSYAAANCSNYCLKVNAKKRLSDSTLDNLFSIFHFVILAIRWVNSPAVTKPKENLIHFSAALKKPLVLKIHARHLGQFGNRLSQPFP